MYVCDVPARVTRSGYYAKAFDQFAVRHQMVGYHTFRGGFFQQAA